MDSLSAFDILALHPRVADLPGDWLRQLARHAWPVEHDPGHRLFRADAPADRLWMVYTGHIRLDLYVPGRGYVEVDRCAEIVGLAALIPPYRWEFGGLVGERFHALEFRAAGLLNLFAESPDLGCVMYARLLAAANAGLRSARQRLTGLTTHPGPGDTGLPARA
ncbi:hypothetical protein [Actinoplanes sp. G11-F43]|uniref:hypothetical protein n=1 Tax=Actinoplanes sp. G11-F43 TaxID=3424130 RepID=UPI003D34FDED